MEILAGMLDLGFARVRGKSGLGLILYRSWGSRDMKRGQIWEEKP